MDSSYGAAREHYDDLLREAEQERLIRQPRNYSTRRDLFYYRLLGWSGHRLTALGGYLLERYGDAEPLHVLQVIQRVQSANGRH
jgi:hypothetical protein